MLEIQGVLWIHVAAANVPHVVFGSLRDIEIFEEVMADLSVPLKTTDHRSRKLNTSQPHEI